MKVKFIITGGLVCFVAIQSFVTGPADPVMLPRLAGYAVYQGTPADLVPSLF
jgi:hypothetical protein